MTTISLTVGQQSILTAQFLDALGNPVTDVDPGLIVWSIRPSYPLWTVYYDKIISIGPDVNFDLSQAFSVVVTGLKVVVQALNPGITNVAATYRNGEQEFVAVTQVNVAPPPVASISVT